VIVCIGNPHNASRGHRQALGIVQPSVRRWASISSESGSAPTGHGSDGTVRPQAADAVVAAVSNPGPAVGSRHHAVRLVQ